MNSFIICAIWIAAGPAVVLAAGESEGEDPTDADCAQFEELRPAGPASTTLEQLLETIRYEQQHSEAYLDCVIVPRHREWLTGTSATLRQPPLEPPGEVSGVTIFRMTRSPAFSGPTSVTVERTSLGGAFLTFRAAFGCRAHRDWRPEQTRRPLERVCATVEVAQRELAADEAAILFEWLDRDAFWSAPIVRAEDLNGRDGCTLFTEGRDGDHYHATSRWTCTDPAEPPIRQFFCWSDRETDLNSPHGDWPQAC